MQVIPDNPTKYLPVARALGTMPPSPPLPRRQTWLVSVGFGVFAYSFHKVGSLAGFYQEFFWFQLLTHLLSSSAMALILLNSGHALGFQGRALVWFVVVLGATGAMSWELVEYLEIFPTLIWWGPEDSLLDLLMDAIGVAAVLRSSARSKRGRDYESPDQSTPTPAD